jgi:TRAP-type mannitol/chloroaromatic compound transport system permease small subunit
MKLTHSKTCLRSHTSTYRLVLMSSALLYTEGSYYFYSEVLVIGGKDRLIQKVKHVDGWLVYADSSHPSRQVVNETFTSFNIVVLYNTRTVVSILMRTKAS